MYVVGDSSHTEAFAFRIPGNRRKIIPKIRAHRRCEDSRTILGAEDDVDEKIGEGLRHGDKDRAGLRPSGLIYPSSPQGDALAWDNGAPSALLLPKMRFTQLHSPIMDNEQVRAFCLALPHVTETVNWGHHLVFFVGDKAIGGKMFALIHLDDAGTGVVWFHAGPERYAELLEIEGIVPAPYMARAHWVTVMGWDVLRTRDLQEELRLAHTLVYGKLPKRTRTILAMPEKERKQLIRERKKLLAEKSKSD